MSTNTLEIIGNDPEYCEPEVVGYFSYDCQDDGYCTYGCGKRPSMVCSECAEGGNLPDNWHPIMSAVEDFIDVCDKCEDLF